MDWFLYFVVSITFNALALMELWIFWRMIVKQYESVRNFFSRNFGFGYALILQPEGRIIKHFVKLKQTIRINEKQYFQVSERVYRFEGLPSLIYNNGDNQPIDLRAFKSDDLSRNAAFMDNLILNVKAGAEAEADTKNSLKELLLWGALLLGLLSVCGMGYIIYLFTNNGAGLGLVLQAS